MMERVHKKHRGQQDRERGVALLSALVALVVIATAAADFAYNSNVDLASAVNARDDLRAHYLARSGVNLSLLLFRVQQKFIDPNRKFFGGMDLQVADYAPMVMSAFNSKEGAEALGSMFGVESSGIKGLGVDVGSFDLELESLDGKLNLNCGGGLNPESPAVMGFAASLAAMMLPVRYNRLFEDPDENGQYADRLEVMRAIIDWADQDGVMFGTSAAEDYRYNAGEDPYENKNHYFDSVEELRLVKGVRDDFMSAFGDDFTVYGDCKVNVNLASVPVLTALLLQHAAAPNDPGLRWENISVLARLLKFIREYYGGFADMKAFIAAVEQPAAAVAPAFATGDTQGEGAVPSGMPMPQGIKLNEKTLSDSVVVGGARRIWRINATAEAGRVRRKITAVWDMKFVSFQSHRNNMGPGGFLFWREE